MKTKILICMFGKGKGGLEQVFMEQTKTLTDAGFDVYAACHWQSPYRTEIEKIAGNPVYHFHFTLKYNPLIYLKIIDMVKHISPDIIFLHGNRAISIFTNPIIKRLLPTNTKLVATAHNYRNNLFSRLDAALAITKDMAKDLQKRKIESSRIFYCPNSVELEPYKEFEPHKPPVIGVMGRLHPVKGFDVFLNACKLLKDRKIVFSAVIGGNGSQLRSLKSLALELGIEKNIHFTGWVENKANFFNQIDIFCLPSRSEALSISLLEAMAHSKPCVITDCPGPSEVVSHCGAGYIVEKENPRKLADSLEMLIKDGERATEFAANGWKTIKEVYAYDKFRERLCGICKAIIKL